MEKNEDRPMVIVHNCFNEVIVFKRRTNPPPLTDSMVLANKFGMIASKSCKTHIPYTVKTKSGREE